MIRFVLLLVCATVLTSCDIKPQKIEYGTDACHYCNMTIVDKQHAAQMVSAKGKSFKYDAIECMVHSLQENMQDTEIALFLVANFDAPGEFINAASSSYLVSEKIQSPMGANLSAFKNETAAQKTQAEFSGDIFSWETIQEHLKH